MQQFMWIKNYKFNFFYLLNFKRNQILRIIITGSTGFIGSAFFKKFKSKYDFYFILNKNLKKNYNKKRSFKYNNNIHELKKFFIKVKPDAVIHFAGLKAVGESVTEPARYYDVNVGGTATLLGAMERAGCANIVFSSSATVYGEPQYLPCDENHPLSPTNPYGRTKLMGENLLQDWSNAKQNRHAVALRYFNPVGADASGLIGEDPNGIPNNNSGICFKDGIRKFMNQRTWGPEVKPPVA